MRYNVCDHAAGGQAVLHVADPDIAAAVLTQSAKAPAYDHFHGFCGSGVFTADGSEWRSKRHSVNHALFKGGRLSGLDALVNAQADLLCAELSAAAAEAESSGAAQAAQLVPDCCTAGDSSDECCVETACSIKRCDEQHCSNNAKSCTQQQLDISSSSSSSRAPLSCTRSADLHSVEPVLQAGEVEMVSLLQHHTLAIIHAYLTGAQVSDCEAQAQLAPRYIAAVVEIRYAFCTLLLNCTLYRVNTVLY
jgi:Cytochrome P450